MANWSRATAVELGRGIAAGEIDPVDLARHFLDAAEAHEYGARIYSQITRERALAEARAARGRAEQGHRLGPLDGVPISWKDLFDSAGTPTEAGTKLMAGRVPERDAEVLATATAGGAVCLGKTHLSEIAFSGLGYNPSAATPPNVNDPGAVPGGSSSGAAASLAFGLAPLAIGSDTGGSSRIPPAWNDLVGYKPTHGALSLKGVVPLAPEFDTVGPLARTVEDAALVTALMAGTRAPDLGNASLKGRRLLIIDTILMQDLEAAPKAAFDSAVDRLANAGAEVSRMDMPLLEPAYALAAILFSPAAWACWRELIEPNPEVMFHEIYERVSHGATVSAADYIAGWTALRGYRAQYAAATAGYDAVICPTAPILPPQVERIASDSAYYKAANLSTLRNTRLANLMGLCSLTLPTGVPSCGVMFSAAAGADGALLRLGAAAEQALA